MVFIHYSLIWERNLLKCCNDIFVNARGEVVSGW